MLKKLLNTAVGILLAVLLLNIVIRNADIKNSFDYLKQVNKIWLAIAVLFYLLSFLARSQKWRLQIESLGPKMTPLQAWHSIILHYMGNIFSVKMGIVLRSLYLKQKTNIPISITFGTFMSENIFDFLSLLFWLLISLFFNTKKIFNLLNTYINALLSTAQQKWIIIVVILTILGFSFYFVWKKLKNHSAKRHFLNFIYAIKNTFKIKPLWLFLMWQGVLWIFLFGMNYFLSKALGIGANAIFVITVSSFIYASWLVPTPGALGSVEFFSLGAFAIFGISQNIALSFGLLSNALTFITTVLLGLISLLDFKVFRKV